MAHKVRGKKGQGKVAKVMREFHQGKLRSGSGQKVTKPAQAKAIAMSEGRRVRRGKRR